MEEYNQGTLFSLALVSKIFSEPALDILWHKLRGWEHFICLLPADARGERTVNVPVIIYKSRRTRPDEHCIQKVVVSGSSLGRVFTHRYYYIGPYSAVSRV